MVDNKLNVTIFLFFPVTDKFSLQAQLVTEGVLSLTDTSETEVDADTFDELVKSGVRNFKVGYRQYPITGKVMLSWSFTNQQIIVFNLYWFFSELFFRHCYYFGWIRFICITRPITISASLPDPPASLALTPAQSPASSISSDSIILPTTKNRKRAMKDLDRDEARQVNLETSYTCIRS